jgi:hypothetical protein
MMRRVLTILPLLMLALAARLLAQVKSGEASLNLSGTISAGYGDDYSNVAASDHSIFGAGAADLSGFYFDPNFLSFNVDPFYNQSRLNSTYQSMTAASGVSASAKIFGGSPFPGSISYSTIFNSSGNYGIPGLPNYTTHGNSDVLALTWGVHLHGLPSLNLSFSNANNAYSVYGAETLGTLHDETFSASSGYQVAGFNLSGGYQHMGAQSLTPEFLSGEPAEQSNSSANSFFFGVGHNLPLNGSISAGATHLKIGTTYGESASDDHFNTSMDTLTGALNFAPVTRLNLGANAFYTDNLMGTLYNTLLTAGATLPPSEVQLASHDLTLTGTANYEMPAEHLNLHGFMERQQQAFFGLSFASDIYSGTVTYSNTLRGGQFNGILGLARTSVSTSRQSLLGLNTSISYTHALQRWNLSGGFAYSQDTQTVLIAYTTSGYNYFGSVTRRLRRRSYWGVSGGGMRSLLTSVPGSANSSQSYSTSLSLPRFSINSSYSTSSGNALLTPTGLVAAPIPVTVLPSSAVVLYSGKSYSVGIGSNPIRGLTLTATYAKAVSGTTSNSLVSSNNYENLYCILMYHLRKLDFQAGYSRLVQGFSAAGTPPTVAGSFFVGVSRWFNFF